MALPQQGIDGIVTRADLANFIQQTVNLPPNLQGTLATLTSIRIEYGAVDASGDKSYGSDTWAVDAPATGKRHLEFTPAFSDLFVLVAKSADSLIASRDTGFVRTTSEVQYEITDLSGTATDYESVFVAVGPR